jgi:5-formyltetrahydrofolate cyclo-ligase
MAQALMAEDPDYHGGPAAGAISVLELRRASPSVECLDGVDDMEDDIDPAVELALRYRAKAALRQRARALRNSIPREAILERSARIAARLEAIPSVASASTIALFWPIERRNEVDLTALDLRLRAQGKRVAYPTIDPDTRVMTFRWVDDPARLEERGLGFREPDPALPETAALDVIVVPALQIDCRGHRIGYGAGFYDRALPRFAPPALAIGVAFSFQLIAEVPVTEGDVALSLVVTDEQVIPSPPAEAVVDAGGAV